MSRGLGKRQRAILDKLTRWGDRRGADRWWLINAGIEGNDFVECNLRSEQSANQRALRTLEARGLVEIKLLPRRSGLLGPMPAQLVARPSFSVAPAQSNDNTYPGDHAHS
jgi:hypothetical protein